MKEVIPDINFEDESWGIHVRESFSIEFNMGNQEILKSFALHIKGSKESEKILKELIIHLNIRASDGVNIY